MLRGMVRGLGLALVVLFAGACGEDDDSGFDDAADAVVGIYQVTTWTRNADACEPGGESLLSEGGHSHAVAYKGSGFGIKFLQLMSCANPADCREKVRELEGGGGVSSEFGYTFTSASGDTLTGGSVSTGFGRDGTCSGASVTSVSLERLDDSAIKVEEEITIADDYPEDSEGFCTTDAAKAAARGKSCSEFELLEAAWVEGL